MRQLLLVVWAFITGMLGFSACPAFSQAFPNKPVRIVTGEPGGSLDILARPILPGFVTNLTQPVILENRPAGVLLGEIVAKANPDGYTVLLIGNSFWLAPFLQDNLPWHPTRDFAPVSLVGSSPLVLVVHPSFPVNSVKELIAFAKAKPGELNYASGPAGAANHLSSELLKSMTGVNIVRVPYKGAAQTLNALMGGEVQLMFSSASPALPLIKSAKLRALAVTSPEPSALLPGLPTVAASGVPGYEASSPYGVFAPRKTPVAIINRLNQGLRAALSQADVKEKIFSLGIEVEAGSPERLAATVESQMARLGKLIKDLGIKVD